MIKSIYILAICVVVLMMLAGQGIAQSLEEGFVRPGDTYRPETWFHLIGGNVSRQGLTVDLEAVAGAGFGGIQLFHGNGRPWPGIQPQITCLSESWSDMIAHAANETQRLGLQFTMQNCPGWAMSGGPWITPDNAMRHLVWSRTDTAGGRQITVQLPQPQPSEESWRDYRDVAVLAFPTPLDDTGDYLIPRSIKSNYPKLKWADLLGGKNNKPIQINPETQPVWLEVYFDRTVTLRSIELPPISNLMMRRIFDPDSAVKVQAVTETGLVDVTSRRIPRANWQDRQEEMTLVLALSDYPARGYRIIFENHFPMRLDLMRLSSAARINDWRGQAGYALRSLDRSCNLRQNSQCWIDQNKIVDLSGKMTAEGRLKWTVPEGQWTIVRFGHVNTGAKNKPAPPEATGFECDKLSPKGAEQHFAGYIGRVSAPNGPAGGGKLKGMLIDSWECYTQTWTPAMEQEFETRRAYSLRKWLPALGGWVVNNPLSSERFLRDWRATISDMLVEHYFGRLAELARERGMKLSFETALGDVSPGDILQYYSKADIPMCEFWQPNDPHWGGLETKPIAPAASAAHIYGKQRIAAESFTNIGIHWNEHPFMLKHLADRHFAMGLNHLIFHTYTHNPDISVVPGTSFGGRIGTPFLRGQTWWKYMPEFTDYLSRCGYMLEQGHPVADVLWYLGDDLDHKPRQDTPFPEGYHFDYLNQDALLHRIAVHNGQLTTAQGVKWKVLWLPADRSERLTVVTLRRLKTLLNQGAVVIGNPPRLNASLSGGQDADREFDALVRDIWGANALGRGDRNIGSGRLIWGDKLADGLLRLGIGPDLTGPPAISWCHRRSHNAEIYFVAADRLFPFNHNLKFRAEGRPEIWDPLTGRIQKNVLYARQGDYISVAMNLPAAGSAFVLFRQESGLSATRRIERIERNGETLADAALPPVMDQHSTIGPFGLTAEMELQPWVDHPLSAFTPSDNPDELIFWQNGAYRIYSGRHKPFAVQMTDTAVINVVGPWVLSFPPGWDTPARIDLDDLMPWSELKDPAVKSFSGTADYRCQFNLDRIEADRRILLDLGRVSNIAEIYVNSDRVSVLWGPPFRVDITSAVQSGLNTLEVKVTNTWHNRLAYEQSQPRAKRKTWTYNQPPADSPLEPAGLSGPVQLYVGKAVAISNLSQGK